MLPRTLEDEYSPPQEGIQVLKSQSEKISSVTRQGRLEAGLRPCTLISGLIVMGLSLVRAESAFLSAQWDTNHGQP